MSDAIRVLLVDDHAVVREGLSALIGTEPDLVVAGEAGDAPQARQLVESTPADVLLLDLVLHRGDGLEVLAAARRLQPGLRVLILTSFSDDDRVLRAVELGARGYLLKDSRADELLDAIRRVHRGQTVLAPSIAGAVVGRLSRTGPAEASEEALTERETEVLILIAGGLSNREIATDLTISERTVRAHVGNLLGKLGLSNRTQAALYAVREGLVKL